MDAALLAPGCPGAMLHSTKTLQAGASVLPLAADRGALCYAPAGNGLTTTNPLAR